MGRRDQEPVWRVGVDEKSFRRGHGYASIMTDLDESRMIEVVKNRDDEAARAQFDSLGTNARQIHAEAMDIWPAAFMGAAAAKAPEAVVVHDRFQVSKHLN